MRSKLIGLTTVMLLVVGAAFLWMFNSQVKTTARRESIAQAGRIVDMAESVRLGMADKWKHGVFSQEIMSEWAKKDETDKILEAVPIVTAWQAVMRRADEGGYTFKTPRFNPRNPDNKPDPIEAEALNLFKKDPARTEYSVIDKDINAVRYFRPIHLTSECLLCHGDPAGSQELWGNEDGLDPTGYHMENLAVGDLHGAYEVVQSLDKADSEAQAAVLKGAGVVSCFLLIGCGVMAWVLNWSLLKPLSEASDAFKRLGAGDLRTRLKVTSGDEIGTLQSGINSMVQRMRELILGMQGNSEDLNVVSEKLSDTAGRVENAVTDTTSRSHSVAAAAEEMSVAMQRMEDSLQSVGDSVQTVAAATTQVNSNAEKVAKSTDEASAIAHQASELAADGGERIRELETAATGIGKIVQVIQDIAEQTNLLALNATIESSRAGDAGKGFAVVANEVKDLSKQTAQATAGIRTEIESIQSLSKSVVDAITSIEEVAGRVSSKTGEISSAVAEQKTAIESVSEQLNSIVENAEDLSTGVKQTVVASQEVTEQVNQVSAIANETNGEIDATKEAGGNVAKVSEGFKELLSDFSV